MCSFNCMLLVLKKTTFNKLDSKHKNWLQLVVWPFLFRVLEKVNFESKFDQLPEFFPGKSDSTSVPHSPSLLLAGLRKRKVENGPLESPASSLRTSSALSNLRWCFVLFLMIILLLNHYTLADENVFSYIVFQFNRI